MRVEIEMTSQMLKSVCYYLGRRYREQSFDKIIKRALIELADAEAEKDLAVIKMAMAAESRQQREQSFADILN